MSKDYQPNSHYCFVCGLKNDAGLHARFENDGPGQVKVEIEICDQHQGYPGIAHGGILATILDETMGRASMSGSPTTRFLYTAKMEIRYRRHVPLHTPIVVRGKIVKDRGRTAAAEGSITLPDGTVAVESSATLFEIPGEELENMLAGGDLGWRVYSDEEFEHERTNSGD